MSPPWQAAPPLRIVVVDDFCALREELMLCLAGPGRQLAGARCGRQLDALLQTQHFDLALLDVNLPGESGYAIAARLRAHHPRMRLLMMTAHGPQTGPHRDALQTPAFDALLHKPVDLVALEALLDSAGMGSDLVRADWLRASGCATAPPSPSGAC